MSENWAHIGAAQSHAGEEVVLKGWLANRRGSGKVQFLHMRDGTGFMQCVMGLQDVDEATFEKCKHLGAESALVVRGMLRADERAPYCKMELTVKSVDVLSDAKEYPIQKKGKG